ncbi:5-oxoprolinase subunit PxpB [Cohnella nanjingensis]|uniref:5-oxoprolinase subunit PxpB n=1 Tax=Cohnella nanjingensis TaxID=1387779 RepID=A0A7X0RNZ3_9BACL|nr:5-oxoprolinase subunit PxpB [Cohnella nanjingensis]MBB6669735.1 5-oxoprolinase subunit PxpB [Cohnella nanjingensis]
MSEWRVETLGDQALLMRWIGTGDLPPSALAGHAQRLRSRAPAWLSEAVPAYDTLTLHLRVRDLPPPFVGELGEWDGAAIEREIVSLFGGEGEEPAIAPAGSEKEFDPDAEPQAEESGELAAREVSGAGQLRVETRETAAREVVLPVRYGGEAGPDLAAAAARSGMSEAEFVDGHSSAAYEVAMIGFAPGFPYLSGLPERLTQPRRASPRLRVPAGSVGIAGRQTGVYPVDSPGGWQIIGRTDVRLFRLEAFDPFPIRPGDRVRFVPVEEPAKERLEGDGRIAEGLFEGDGQIAEGMFEGNGRIAEGMFEGDGRIAEAMNIRAARPADEMDFTVLAPGLYTTVQDLQRPGWQAFGVSVGGAMDREACRAANALVGNGPDEAVLELTLQGGRYRFLRDCLAALAGADLESRIDGEPFTAGRPVLLRAGSELSVGRAQRGCRAYLAFAGGIDVPRVLGSRSTDPRAGIGGVDGRPLAAGDTLRLWPPSPAALRLMARLAVDAERQGKRWAAAGGGFVPGEGEAPDGPAVVLRVVRGRGWDLFAPEARARLLLTEYRVQPASDRMGVRLTGSPLALRSPFEAVSHGVTPGTLQVPPDGQPIVLGPGCQPTGGYPILAHVIAADLPKLGQLQPGQRIAFEAVSLSSAHAALAQRAQDRALREAGIRLAWYTNR